MELIGRERLTDLRHIGITRQAEIEEALAHTVIVTSDESQTESNDKQGDQGSTQSELNELVAVEIEHLLQLSVDVRRCN